MNIAFVISKNYIGPLKTTMYSLYLNNKEEDYNVFIFEKDLDEDDYNNLKEFFSKIKAKVSFFKVDESVFENAKKMNSDTSYTTYYKFFIFNKLIDVDKVLYLDCDIVVDGSIKDFYYKEYDTLICAIKDNVIINSNKRHIKDITGSKKNDYFNAGVILFNIKDYKEKIQTVLEKLINYSIKNKDILIMHDQDALNHFFYDNVTYIDKKYNFFSIFTNISQLLFPISIAKDIRIIHYVGFKPWKKGYIGLYRKKYLKYYRLTSSITNINYLEKNNYFFSIKNYFIMIRTLLHRTFNRMLGM